MPAKKKWKALAVRNVLILFICLLKNKRKDVQELIKGGMFLIRRGRGGFPRGNIYSGIIVLQALVFSPFRIPPL